MRPALAFLASVTALAAAEVTFTKQTITKVVSEMKDMA